MNTKRIHITGVSKKTPDSLTFNISGSWLPAIGFEPDALVQFVPVKDGMNFTLYNTNLPSYSELVRETKARNGKLLSPRLVSNGNLTTKEPGLIMTGKFLSGHGWKRGDSLILRYRYGFIQAKQCDPTWFGCSESEHPQVFTVRSMKTKNTIPGEEESPRPRIRLGSWIAEAGFEKDAVISVSFQPDSLTFTLEPEGISRYDELVKKARANRRQLLQVQEDTQKGQVETPYLHVNDFLLSRIGVEHGDVVITTHRYGQIQCKKVPWERLGFDPFP